MREYTDVAISIEVSGYALDNMDNIHITFRQNDTVIDITDYIVTGEAEIKVLLTQEQTRQFKANAPVSVELNFFDEYGHRGASDIVEIPVKSNLLRRIIHE